MSQQKFSIRVAGVLLVVGASLSAALAQNAPGRAVSYHQDVRPILEKRCSGCHQPAIRSGKLSLSTYAAVKSGGIAGAGFVSGKPADSPLYKTISGKSPSMPKGGPPLSSKEVDTIRLWIEQGGRDDTPQPKDPISQATPPVYTRPPVVTAMTYSPDGELLAISGYREILLRKADGSATVARLVGRSQRIEGLAFSPDGKYLAAVGGNTCRFGELQIWDVAARKQIKSQEIGFDVLYGVSFSPDGKLVAFGSAEKSAYLYSVPECQQLLKFDNHSDWVFGTTFSRDGKNMVTTSRDRAIKLVEIATKNFVDDINYQVYNGGYNAIARNPMSDEVAVGGDEGIIRYYSIYKKQARTMNREDYNLLRTYEKMPPPIYALAFSPDGAILAAGSRTGDLWLFKTGETTPYAKIKAQEGSIHTLAWHPKGGQLAVSGFDGSVRLYEMPAGKELSKFTPVPLAQQLTKAGEGSGPKTR